jgi:hypothetical protein
VATAAAKQSGRGRDETKRQRERRGGRGGSGGGGEVKGEKRCQKASRRGGSIITHQGERWKAGANDNPRQREG